MRKIRTLITLALALVLLLPCFPVSALVPTDIAPAKDITAATAITGTGYENFAFLQDGNAMTYRTSSGNAQITLENPKGMGSLYLMFDLEPGSYTITDNKSGVSVTAGTYGILHEFVDLYSLFGSCPVSVTLNFGSGSVRLSEIYAFTYGQTPDFAQKWQAPLENGADIVLFSTHSDDDQLFFAGLVPLYAGEKNCRVQVVLMTDHRKGPFATNLRTHEVINGLWAAGLTAYPVFGQFVDYRIDSLDGMYDYYESLGTTKDDLMDFMVTQLRRFKPQVAITHDINGEYGHGMHRIYADLLINALDITNDPAQYPDSANKYGTWDVPKAYLHLYSKNKIVIDYDTPLDRFDGMTAFQVSQKLGYPCHKTQQYTWFTTWINGSTGQITKATQISSYNPAHFGLYRSTVGEDVAKNDFLENITPYDVQDQQAADAVMAQIKALFPITLDSGDAIAAAQAAFDALTDAQKALISDANALVNAENEWTQLKIQQAENRSAAQKVMALIDQIGTVTLESEVSIKAAQEAYEQLTGEQKLLVSNYQALRSAQNQLTVMQMDQRTQQALLQTRRENLVKYTVLGALLVLLLGLPLLRQRRKRRKTKKFLKK